MFVFCVAVDIPQRFNQLPVSGHVCGIAQLRDEIFVCFDSSPSIAVFSFQGRQNFKKREEIRFHELTTPPQDIAASDEFQRLFVADPSAHCVWQLEWSSRLPWKPKGKAVSDVTPMSLSMNARRLLVVEAQRLAIFEVDKKKLKSISLPKNLQAEHALETPCETFVVCGREAEKPSIVEVNRRGGVVRMCNWHGLNFPCYLSAFSTDEADLLVVDGKAQSVLLLNSGLEVVRVFLDACHNGVLQPSRIVKYGYFLVGHVTSSEDCLGVVSLYGPHRSALQALPD